jgi:hypothetical protein
MSFDFYTSAFHPKALNNVCVDVAGLLAWVSLIAFPSRLCRDSGRKYSAMRMENKNGKQDKPIHHFLLTIHHLYSYGDSTGFAPDFPFNPDSSGTKSATNVVREVLL